MVSFTVAFLALTSAVVVSADYWIDPDSVPLGTRQAWCRDEKTTCPIICAQTSPGTVLTNTCDPGTLTYGCVCGNGLQPNVSEYSLTIPFYTCQEWGNQCVKACGQDNACSSSCRQDHPCGALSPTRVNTTSSATSAPTAPASTTANQIFTGLGGSSPSNSPSGNAAPPALAVGSAGGFALLAAGMLAGFAFML